VGCFRTLSRRKATSVEVLQRLLRRLDGKLGAIVCDGDTWWAVTADSAKMRDPSRRRGSHALYQGTTLVVSHSPKKDLGFRGCVGTGAQRSGEICGLL
jgi:hypothetical protein